MNVKKTLRNRSGFTLLEIIIVIIIIGVLAALALPQMFKTVENSRSAEGLSNASALRDSLARYALRNGSRTSGATPTNLDIPDPSSTAAGNGSSLFNYAITGTAAGKEFTITATRNTTQGGNALSNIVLTEDASGTVTKSGNTAFSGI